MIQRNSIIELFGGIDNFLIYHDLKKADVFAEENDLNINVDREVLSL